MSNKARYEALGLNKFLAVDRAVNLAVQNVEIWMKGRAVDWAVGRAVDWAVHRAVNQAVDEVVYYGLKENRLRPGLSLYLGETG